MEQPEYFTIVTQLEELLRWVEALELSQRPPVLERKLMHRILLVRKGNFSFSSSLANAFDCAHNIVARSLDSRGLRRKKT
ncbi:hypothetical protein SUGI_0086680 [Cryptomeria japonica]|nr:hypothetical protein SUGI_0086680 [Cryptomeria japonica]